MEKCFIVVHRNYAEGVSACAFWNEEDAKKAVDEEVEVELKNLKNDGYISIGSSSEFGSELYVLNSDIYYEWEIVEANIR